MLCGVPVIDVQDMKANTSYQGQLLITTCPCLLLIS